MKLSGIEVSNFRSVGEKPIKIFPLKKCNILIGQNNVGKSNVIKAIKIIFDHLRLDDKIGLDELDLFNRDKDKPFLFTIYFNIEASNQSDSEFKRYIEGDIIWFKFKWGYNSKPQIVDYTFARVTDQKKSGLALNRFTGRQWTRPVSAEDIFSTFLQEDNKKRVWGVFKNFLPTVNIIPEFRQIRKGDKLTNDGQNLIETLAHYQHPEIGKDEDQVKFNNIEKFLRILLNLPDAKLEVSKNNSTLIINNGIRLPLSSFGTSVHELLILLTSITLNNHSICCIEEPEIHFHPRLQKAFLEFLLSEPQNTFILSTHSPAIINSIRDNLDIQLIHLKRIENTTEQISVQTKSDLWEILKDIGTSPSDLLQTNCIIWVEGPSDTYYINKWISLLDSNLKENKDYSFFCYRNLGKLLIDAEDVDNGKTNVLSVNRNSIVIMDSDKNKESEELKSEKKQVVESCKENNTLCWVTLGKEIENYLSTKTIKKAVLELRKSEIEIKFGLFDKFAEKIDSALIGKGLETLNYNKNKNSLSKKIAEFIEKDDIQEELKESLKSLIEKIKSFN